MKKYMLLLSMLLTGATIQTTQCGNNPDIAGGAMVLLPVAALGIYLGVKQLASSNDIFDNIFSEKISPITLYERLKVGGALTAVSSALLALSVTTLYQLFFTNEDFGWSK